MASFGPGYWKKIKAGNASQPSVRCGEAGQFGEFGVGQVVGEVGAAEDTPTVPKQPSRHLTSGVYVSY